jgi:hypothetical protein
MKKGSLRFIVIALLSLFSLVNIDAAKPVTKTEKTTVSNPPPPEVQKLIDRVYEIKAMDMSKMTVSEKKALRTELKSVKKELKAVEAIYIPIGTAIIVLLLLLLLL